MTSTKPSQVQCPTCRRSALWSEDNPYRPFCSERCRLIDLGEWASENRRIAGDPDFLADHTDSDDSVH